MEARNVNLEYRWAEDKFERLPTLADDLVARKVSFMTLLGGAAGAWPFGASTQQPAKGGLGHAKIDANDPTRTSVRSREQQLSLGFQTIQACPGAR